MSSPRHSGLHEFSQLLNASTAAAKVSQALVGHEAPTTWAQAAQNISAAMLASDGKKIWAPSVTPTHRSWGSPEPDKPSYFDHPLTMPSASFSALKKALGDITSAQVELAAASIAKQLVVPFEKDGVPHLAFPHQSNGLKIRRRKNGPAEVYDWNSDWTERAKTALPQNNVFVNRHGKYRNKDSLDKLIPDEQAALASIAEYLSHIPLNSQTTAVLGEFALRGVHAGGKLAGSASSEQPLASLSPDTNAPAKPSESYHAAYETLSVGLAHNDSFDPSSRRLGWTAIALLLGDTISAADAASAHCAPAMRAEASVQLEAGAKAELDQYGTYKHSAVVFPGASRAKRPAVCTMQAAATLVSTDTYHRHSRSDTENDRNFLTSFAYSSKKGLLSASDPATILADHKAALSLVKSIEFTSKIIMDRAYDLARGIEEEWFETHDLAQALSDAKLLGSGKASAKSLNWALANPAAAEGLRNAADNPELGFASKSARYLGLRAEGEQQTIERAKAAWAQRGLGPEGFLGVSSDEACTTLLSNAWTAELEEKKRERKPFLKSRVELIASSLHAAFASGACATQAQAFCKWCSGTQQSYFLHDTLTAPEADDKVWDRLQPDMPPRLIGLAAEAEKFSTQARARADGYPLAMQSVYRAFALGEDMPAHLASEEFAKEREKLAAAWLTLAVRGPSKSPCIDWSSGLAESSLRDLAIRSGGTLSAAMRSAAKDGPHGVFSARVAIGLGIEDATDANDLVSQVRGKLREDFALSDGGWKALGKAPVEMVEHLASQIESRIPEVLESRAKRHMLLGASAMKSQAAVGLGLSLLSGAAAFGLDLKDAALVEELGRQRPTGERSELLLHGIRPISASSAQSADFARAEAQAKSERLPRIAKTMGERAAKTRSELILQGHSPEDAKAQAMVVLGGEVALIDDWLKNSEDGVWQTLPPKAGFSDLMRRQAIWHEDTVAKIAAGEKAGKSPAQAWPTPLARHSDGEWSAVLLGTASELSEEGRLMHHCVSSYSGACRHGSTRIYSVRLNGERVSTLELKLTEKGTYKPYDHQHPREDDVWTLSQNNGKCNARINDPSALAFCNEVAERMNLAHIHWCKELAAKRSLIAKMAAESRKTSTIKIG